MERKKYCPVCGDLAAVLDGDPNKYGAKAVPYHAFIRIKYDCDECRAIMTRQSKYLSNKRRRRERKQERTVLLDVVGAYREEAKLSKECAALLARENHAVRQRIAALEAREART